MACNQRYQPTEVEDQQLGRKIQGLLNSPRLTILTLGSYLGRRSRRAEYRAERLLQFIGLLPTRESIVLCEHELADGRGRPVLDSQGNAERCGNIMVANNEPSRRLGFRWRCIGSHGVPGTRRLNPNRSHQTVRLSPLCGTLFENIRLPFRKFLQILVVFLRSGKITNCLELGITRDSAVEWFDVLRDAFSVCAWHDFEKIGGPGDVVEVDEVRLFKRKSNKGRIPKGDHWVFGGVSRATGLRFAVRVNLRDMRTLHAEIIDCIEDDSVICSDGWAAYNRLLRLRSNGRQRYRDHLVVIHDRNFLNPPRTEDPFWRNDIMYECRDKKFNGPPPRAFAQGYLPFRAHTQNIERAWRQLRKRVSSTRSFDRVDRYIGMFMYEENVLKRMGGSTMEKLRRVAADLSRVHPGPNQVPIRTNKPFARMFPPLMAVDLCECDECSNL